MGIFLVELGSLAGKLRDRSHRVVARQGREVDSRVAHFVHVGIVVAFRGFADAGDLLVYLGFAPRGSIFVQMVGVFHNNRCFYKIRKKYSYARFPSVNFSRHTGYPAKKEPEPPGSGSFYRLTAIICSAPSG